MNYKMQTIVGILKFMTLINGLVYFSEQEHSLIHFVF